MLATDLKTGTIFKENGQPFLVIKYEHIKSARGGANVKVRARNLLTEQVLEKSYLASAKMESADVFRKNAQYLYKENESYVFMDPDTYEQIYISADLVGETSQFLKEGENVQVMYFESRPVSVETPITMVFEVTYTEPGFKGNTVSNVYKDAILDNGASVKVPTFIKIGDKVKIDTRSGTYVSKA
ncbi:elongation factor P [candidate division WWE3 bacterium]|jgi:elongation factor P|uniref:Elongation factor P n=1 Tax=candidate division WWE3 bacterium TaxID=2053526 RepID=A0A3A4ZDK9_UNCKA|nr:MAG: elongation factor P [candidate division WWE3 bacterium]